MHHYLLMRSPKHSLMHCTLTEAQGLCVIMQLDTDNTEQCTVAALHESQLSCRLQILALDDIRNEMIGDEEVRGISGGQRKRVNVGLELVADPIMLFLDEPTSGLDSTSSKMVISALQEVSSCLHIQPPPVPLPPLPPRSPALPQVCLSETSRDRS